MRYPRTGELWESRGGAQERFTVLELKAMIRGRPGVLGTSRKEIKIKNKVKNCKFKFKSFLEPTELIKSYEKYTEKCLFFSFHLIFFLCSLLSFPSFPFFSLYLLLLSRSFFFFSFLCLFIFLIKKCFPLTSI